MSLYRGIVVDNFLQYGWPQECLTQIILVQHKFFVTNSAYRINSTRPDVARPNEGFGLLSN